LKLFDCFLVIVCFNYLKNQSTENLYPFLNEGGVTVTNARFVVPAQTYAMSGVTSVKSLKHTPSIKGPVILCIIGLLSMGGGKDAIYYPRPDISSSRYSMVYFEQT
jgi:hypothetical protein